ncbi:hypothetical protein KIK84_04965 [Curvibacter sp. CHRR-16]|uniref:hypothetical protein n=1 Tax=Curvibacter sp. CHRR-16 TaxID=2835872 RepID=UPI001BDAEA79|nr:hypothetical protein [Curvibacter sp. CHRR-16]MBT0569665.1 hypothetical protein [Curvibacter sp. CHRR-16]
MTDRPSPLAFLANLAQHLPTPPLPPQWLVEEMQRKLVLVLNHILQQEPQAMERLRRQQGHAVLFQWQQFTLYCKATPAGLLDLAAPTDKPALTLTILAESAVELVQHAVQGSKPPVRIEGDVQLAAEMNWLTQHVRWDVEEDLARVLGDVQAHQLVRAARWVAQALQQWVAARAAPAA